MLIKTIDLTSTPKTDTLKKTNSDILSKNSDTKSAFQAQLEKKQTEKKTSTSNNTLEKKEAIKEDAHDFEQIEKNSNKEEKDTLDKTKSVTKEEKEKSIKDVKDTKVESKIQDLDTKTIEKIESLLGDIKNNLNSLKNLLKNSPKLLAKLNKILDKAPKVFIFTKNIKIDNKSSLSLDNLMDFNKQLEMILEKLQNNTANIQNLEEKLLPMLDKVEKTLDTAIQNSTITNTNIKLNETSISDTPKDNKSKIIVVDERSEQNNIKENDLQKDQVITSVEKNTNDSENNINHLDSTKNTLNVNQTLLTNKNATVEKNYEVFSSPINRSNMENIIEQLSGKIFMHLKDGKQELKMQLNPAELGSIKLSFEMKDSVMVGKIVVNTSEAKMLFEQNQQFLSKAMEDMGITLSQFDISKQNENSQSFEEKNNSLKAMQNELSLDIENTSNLININDALVTNNTISYLA